MDQQSIPPIDRKQLQQALWRSAGDYFATNKKEVLRGNGKKVVVGENFLLDKGDEWQHTVAYYIRRRFITAALSALKSRFFEVMK